MKMCQHSFLGMLSLASFVQRKQVALYMYFVILQGKLDLQMWKMTYWLFTIVSCKWLSETPPSHFLRLSIISPLPNQNSFSSSEGQASPAQIQTLGSSPGIHGAIWRLASTHVVLHISLSEKAATKCCYENQTLFFSIHLIFWVAVLLCLWSWLEGLRKDCE